MTTTNLSNERLALFINSPLGNGLTRSEQMEMARELLALREAAEKPVATMHRLVNKRNGDEHPWVCSVGVRHSSEGDIFRVEVQHLYAAPQLPSEPVSHSYKLPMQPLVVDSRGTLRFKENTIVRKLLDFGTAHGYGLNLMAVEDFTPEDRMQFAQLIGYSLSGYGTLSYVTDDSYDRAIAAAPQLPGNTEQVDAITQQYESLAKSGAAKK